MSELSQTASSLFIPEDNVALSSELTRLAGHINAAQYRFLKLLAVLIEREAWGEGGMKSPAHWLNYYCGIDLGAAREKVRVAKSLHSLPRIDTAFRSGEISYSKVRAMTRSATPENEEMLLQVAQHGTAQHVEQLVRRYRRVSRINDLQHDRDCYEHCELNCHFDDDGMLVIHGRLMAEDGAAFMNVLNAMVGVMNPPTAPDTVADAPPINTQKTFPQKRADALVALAEHAACTMDNGPQTLISPEKAQIIVHMEPARVEGLQTTAELQPQSHTVPDTGFAPQPDCSVECGGSRFHISPFTARRLSCDSSVQSMLQDFRGNVLDVGRRTRAVSPALRRALILRDQSCIFPGCCESRFVDAHHVKHWCDGGATSLDNLVLLCRHHHRLLHQQQFEIARDAQGGFECRTPNGCQMPRALAPQFVDINPADEQLAIEREHRGLGLEINAMTAVTSWRGESMDYGLAVGVMLDVAEMAS